MKGGQPVPFVLVQSGGGKMSQDDDETDEALVMPFVVCRSSGGLYDDDSFLAGMYFGRACASMDEEEIWMAAVPTQLIPQLDLLAMGSRANLIVQETDSEYWTYVELHPINPQEDPFSVL